MISIIIPIYNQGDKLGDCLNSILNQAYHNYEVIIINDGSKDNSLEAAKKYQNKFWNKKIRYKVISQENKGAPSARNKGWKESKGDYLFFCDADAILEINALKDLLDALKSNPEASYAFSSFRWGKKLFKIGEFNEGKLKQGPMIHTMSLIRTGDFPKGGWDENIKKFQDWDLYLTMLENKKRGVWIDKVLFKIKPGGTMSDWLPGFAYKLFPFLPAVKKYNRALKIIKKKHNL